MNYCCYCGSRVVSKIPPDDDRPRYVCTSCETIHYQNPKIVAGCIPARDTRILLCRRAIEPRRGFWTLPAGYMELGETSLETAIRETLEEANASVKVVDLFAVFNLPHVNQVYLMFRSELQNMDFSPGAESLEVALFGESQIPWDEIAFMTVRQTLKFYFQDLRAGGFHLHTGDIVKQENLYNFRAGPSEANRG